MWIFTKHGYYSIVHDKYCKENEVMIRSRCKDDLIKFMDAVSITGKIIEIGHADYAYRLPVKRDILSNYLSNYALKDLTYPNFKNTIPKDERARHDAYFKCWSALHQFQNSDFN